MFKACVFLFMELNYSVLMISGVKFLIKNEQIAVSQV